MNALDPAALHETERFLQLILPPEGWYCAAVFEPRHKAPKHYWFKTVEELAAFVLEQDVAGNTVYHACASFRDPKRGRKAENVNLITSLWGDVDGKDYRDQGEMLTAVAVFADAEKKPLSALVNSGHGLHGYWRLERPLTLKEWLPYARGFKALAEAKGLKLDPARTADAASILRSPGTHNRKNGAVVDVSLIAELEEGKAISLSQLPRSEEPVRKAKASDAPAIELPPYLARIPILKGADIPDEALYPSEPADANAIADRCAQMRAMRNTRGRLTEPLWRANIGVLAHCADGERIAHEWSKGDERYNPEETQKKIDAVLELSGPITCQNFIDNDTEHRCQGCPFRGHVTTPLQLGRERWAQHPLASSAQEASSSSDAKQSDAQAEILRQLREGQAAASNASPPSPPGGVTIKDFWALLSTHEYIFQPTGEPWPAASVNSIFPPIPAGVDNNGNPKTIKPSAWLDQNRAVHQQTWAPGHPPIIDGFVINQAGWEERKGVRAFNLYRPPSIIPGDASQAGPWLDHIRRLYGQDAVHLIRWLAHRVQKPHEKINHVILLGGAQGIGKDTILEPVKDAVGPWNFQEIGPQQLLGRFNGFAKSVILRVSEIRDLGEGNRFEFYNTLKKYAAAPPDRIQVDEKNVREYLVSNVCGVVITANEKNFHLPPDDRRHFIAWSPLPEKTLDARYFKGLYDWYDRRGGRAHVTAFLRSFDLSDFDPKAPPPRTDAWHDIVGNSASPDDAELADALEAAGNPEVITPSELTKGSSFDLHEFLTSKKFRSQHRHRFAACGYTRLHNSGAKDGLWKIDAKRQVVYARDGLSKSTQLEAVRQRYKLASGTAS